MMQVCHLVQVAGFMITSVKLLFVAPSFMTFVEILFNPVDMFVIITPTASRSVQRTNNYLVYLFLAFDFCRFCVVIRFFHPGHNGPL